jgi:hypothetical protein
MTQPVGAARNEQQVKPAPSHRQLERQAHYRRESRASSADGSSDAARFGVGNPRV